VRALYVLIWVVFLSTYCAGAQTLRDFLATNNIPSASFGDVELATPMQGISKSDKDRTVIAFRNAAVEQKGSHLVGPVQVMQYDRVNDAALRSQLPLKDGDECDGTIEDVYFVTGFMMVGMTTSPSAGCLFVLGTDLQLTQTLHGFAPVEVMPDLVVVTESMRHFAPVHPGRLQLADLSKRTVSEIYPAKGDALRARLAQENEKHMPAKEVCMRTNDPCEAGTFDEDIHAAATDRKGHFAFIVDQAALHATQEGRPPNTVAAQKVFYLYARTGDSWVYCQDDLKGVDVEALDDGMQANFLRALDRCTPALPVVPDMSTAEYNPFLTR
jgi:hypothetical protein